MARKQNYPVYPLLRAYIKFRHLSSPIKTCQNGLVCSALVDDQDGVHP